MANQSYRDKPGFDRITINDVREFLHYNPESGVLTWKVIRGSTVRPGDSAQLGQMSLFGIRFPTAAVIWFMMTEKWPDGIVSHLNRNNNDNRWHNLRDTSQQVALVDAQLADQPEMIKVLQSGEYAVNIEAGGQMLVVGIYKKYEIAAKVLEACQYLRDILKG